MSNLNSVLKLDFYKLSVAIILVGFGAGVASFLLHESVDVSLEFLKSHHPFEIRTFIFTTLLALSSYYLTKHVFKGTSGSGIPHVKLSLVAYKGKMSRRMPFGKFITSFLTLCTGLSFGKEGPLVTICASWGHLVSHTFKLSRQEVKMLVTSGATAGLAAAFNTPIAAVVFTIEEVLGELNTKYLGPIITASVIASVTSYKLLGNKSTFESLSYTFDTNWHLILYFILGLIMSIVGYVFVKMILLSKDLKRKYFEKYDYLYIIFAIFLVSLASQYSTEVLGDGTSTINKLMLGSFHQPLSFILILFVLKLILTANSYSTGLSGGLFMPVLFLGAIGGSTYALMLQKMGIENIEVGAYALLGMTSLLVAVIRTPFTAFIMLFEMTKDYELILPLMVSSIVAYRISDLINPESVYESVAEYEGVHLPTANDNECLSELSVEDCMITDIVTLDYKQRIFDLREFIEEYNHGAYPVLRKGKLIGVVPRYDIRQQLKAEEDVEVSKLVKYSTISIYPDQSLLVAFDRMKRFEIGRLPVVSRVNDKKLLGIITPEVIINYLGLQKEE